MENNNKMKFSDFFVYLASVLFSFVFVFQVYAISQSGIDTTERDAIRARIKKNENEIEKITEKILNSTSEKVVDKIVEDDVDIKRQIDVDREAVQRVFENFYNKHEISVPDNFSGDLAEELTKLNVATVNQTGKEQRYFEKMLSQEVAYGQYDVKTNTIPFINLVTYESPVISTQITGGNIQHKETEEVIKGVDVYSFTGNLKEKTISFDEYNNIPNTGEESDEK